MRPASQSGAALLTVLTVLAVMGVVVGLLLDRTRSDIRPWALESERTQATYLAESGIAYQLYLERFSDSAEPSFTAGKVQEDTGGFALAKAPTDTFRFHLDTAQKIPDVTVDRARAFLEITSIGRYRNTEVTVLARYGRALDDSIFGPALTLENSTPLEPYSRDQIIGAVRIKSPSPGMPSVPWPASLSLPGYAASLSDAKYNQMEAALQKKLVAEGGVSGNGSFNPRHPPEFPKGHDLFFPLGQVELANDADETWVIRGPCRIFADGEIRIRGRIRLENVELFSGKDITFEDSVTGSENTVFARGSIFIHDRCNLGLDAVAGKDILLQNRSQTTLASVLISVGNRHAATGGGDSVNAIRVVNQAVARGFLIAAGPTGRVALATPANIVEGVVIASAVWLAGEVHGAVLTQKLLCEGTNVRNCLGTGKINRSRLPAGFVQPLQLGNQDRRRYTFKLMDWQRS